MKNNIIKSICALAIASLAIGCQDYNEQLEGYVSDPEITDIQNIVITLTESDYSAIASEDDNVTLAAELGMSDELAAVATAQAFTSTASADLFLPAYLKSLYNSYLTTGSTATIYYNIVEEVISGGEALILEGGNDFPSVAPYGDVDSSSSITYDNVYFNSSYNSFSFVSSRGFFSNSADLTGLSQIVVTEDYTYYNLTLYVGATSDAIDTKISYEKTDDDYVYTIPDGNLYFKLINESTYTASADVITITCDGVDTVISGDNLPTSSTIGSVTVSGYVVNYDNAYYSSYGSYTIPKGSGSISNSTELVDLSRIVVTDDYSHYNFTLYVGASADATTTELSYTVEGDDRIYDVPSGNGFFKFVNDSNYSAQGDKIAFTCGEPQTEDVITECSSSYCLTDYVWGPKTYLTLTDNTTMPDYGSQSEDIGTFDVDGVTFEYKWAYYSTSYGSLTIQSDTDGYWRNLTELPGLSKVIVTEDYSYYNLELYAGTASGSEDTLIEYSKSGYEYTYTIPEGYNFVKFVNNSSYSASCDLVVYEFNGL